MNEDARTKLNIKRQESAQWHRDILLLWSQWSELKALGWEGGDVCGYILATAKPPAVCYAQRTGSSPILYSRQRPPFASLHHITIIADCNLAIKKVEVSSCIFMHSLPSFSSTLSDV